MATKKMNKQYFVLSSSENKQIVFFCYTTKTRLGFCHTVVSLNNSIYGDKIATDTKTSYLNRTWERYDYESTLKKACKKIGRDAYKKAFLDNELNRTF